MACTLYRGGIHSVWRVVCFKKNLKIPACLVSSVTAFPVFGLFRKKKKEQKTEPSISWYFLFFYFSSVYFSFSFFDENQTRMVCLIKNLENDRKHY